MKIQSVEPTGQTQTFEVNETFFSTTDAHGVIQQGNEVFSRVSGYSMPELLGQPHNIIRHRDMPRAVFLLLWQTARDRAPFMGYVKNQAKNGNHYWVFAIIIPLKEGFLSVRIKPTSALLATVETLYAEMRAVEGAALTEGKSESQAAEASAAILEPALKSLGFSSYASFSHHALITEIKSRDKEVAAHALQLFPTALPGAQNVDEYLRTRYLRLLRTYEAVNSLFECLDSFISMCNGIRDRQDAVKTIVEEFRLNALNTHIAANPLGEQGATLGTVAQLLNAYGLNLARNVNVLASNITGTTTAVANLASNLSSARIQLEMLLKFTAEIADRTNSASEKRTLLVQAKGLSDAFVATLDHGFEAIETLQKQIPHVIGTEGLLRKDIIYLQVAQISGLTEVSRITQAENLTATFTGLRSQIETGKQELDHLGNIVEQLTSLVDSTPPKVEHIRESVRLLHETAA